MLWAQSLGVALGGVAGDQKGKGMERSQNKDEGS